MTDAAIRVEGLGKRYRIGRRGRGPYATFREALAGAATAPFRWFRRNGEAAGGSTPPAPSRVEGLTAGDDHIWALKDVSFEVKRGEVVGVIGRNGAGKSTLLKILSRITAPTEGYAEVRGRVRSLLEVGTGFHPELTGRENIYLNGAILGMKRAEIRCKFDEIVAFSEIERFLDTPVKHYSSGMYVRLAFAVAAHLEPEILLVDEVLAVGDASFQRKCLEKMGDVARMGRSVLFVSHNMAAIARLCTRALLLDQGRFLRDGKPAEVMPGYLSDGRSTIAERAWPPGSPPGDDVVSLYRIRVVDPTARTAQSVDIRSPMGIEVEYSLHRPGHRVITNLHFFNESGVFLFVSADHQSPAGDAGIVRRTCWIPGNFLAEGQIWVHVLLCTFNPNINHAWEKDIISFRVVDPSRGDGARGEYANEWPGVVRPLLQWTGEEYRLPPAASPVQTGDSPWLP